LDWILEALQAAGIGRIVFVGGYQIERIRSDYPHLLFYENPAWRQNNILASLFCAEAEMDGPFLCSYADILYRSSIVRRLLASPHDITIATDVAWRRRYAERLQHPEHDAEKVRAEGDKVLEIGRTVPAAEAEGEYIGLAHFSARGASLLRREYQRARREHPSGPYRSAESFEKAYLIDLFQDMIEGGVPFHKVDTHG